MLIKFKTLLCQKKRRQEKWFHNCISAIEKGDCKEVQTYLSLYPNLPKDVRWANKNTRIPSMGVMQLCTPLGRALCPQHMTNDHHKIVKILLENGSDPLRPATAYYEGCRIIDQAIQKAFADTKRSDLKNPSSPARRVLYELLSWVADNHNIDDVLCTKDTWRNVSRKDPKLCKEILDDAKNANSLKSVCVESEFHQPQEDTSQIIRRLKI